MEPLAAARVVAERNHELRGSRDSSEAGQLRDFFEKDIFGVEAECPDNGEIFGLVQKVF